MALDLTTALTIRAKVDGIAQIDGLTRSLGAADKQANGLGGSFQKLGGIAKSTGTLLAGIGTAAIGGLAVLGKKSIDAADNLNDLSQRTGVSVESLSKFGAAAEDSGSSVDEVAKAMSRLQKGVVDPSSKASEALRSIGVASTDSLGKIRPVDAVMLDIADKFSKLQDPAQKTALAMDLFGKSGTNLIPMLNEGKDALSQYAATIDTEFAQGADKLNDTINEVGRSLQGPFNEALTALLPAITKMGEAIAGFAKWFMDLPQPVKDLATGFAAVAIPLAAIAIPVAAVVTAFTTLAPVITAIVALFTGPVGIAVAIAALIVVIYNFRDEIGAAFMAAWESVKSAVAGILQTIGQIGQSLFDVFVQPVIDAFGQLTQWFVEGWVAVFDYIKDPFMRAMGWLNENFVQPVIQFGKQVVDWYTSTWIGIFDFIKQPFMQALEFVSANFVQPFLQYGQQVIDWFTNTWGGIVETIKQPFVQGVQFIQESFVAPIQQALQQAIEFIKTGWGSLKDVVAAPFVAGITIVKSAINSIMGVIEGGINGAVAAINRLIAAANKVPGVKIPFAEKVTLPRFAEGGVVSGPTIAMVGEGGEPEYIVPQSKAGGFAANWMAGKRGASAIPRFAEGGVVVPASANVSIQTGPVTQMDGTNYVTTQDLSRAVQTGINQTLSLIAGNPRLRSQMGIA